MKNRAFFRNLIINSAVLTLAVEESAIKSEH